MGSQIPKTKHSYISLASIICLSVIICTVLFLFLQHTQAFIYFYREQQQIFLQDYDYQIRLLKAIGGFTILATQWLVQFFVFPYMGAVVSALLCVTSAIFFFLSIGISNNKNWWILLLTLTPSVLYCLRLEEVYVQYEGLVTITIGALFMWVYSLLQKKQWYIRLTWGIILILMLFYLVGTIAFVFCIATLLLELLRKNIIKWLPDLREKSFSFWQQIGLSACLFAAWCIVIPLLHKQQANHTYYTLLEQIHFADIEKWDMLAKVEGINPSNDIQMNYLNLALSHQGRLLDQLFAYQQKDIGSLITRETPYTDVGVLLSRIYYQIGAIGAAQNQAFSSTVGITYGNPSMAKLLVKTYLINGYYALAEKQIKLLEKTMYYADWASEQRRFLYNDAAVEADAELGAKRRCLAPNDRFTMLYGPISDMVDLLQNNPNNKEAGEYLLSMLLVPKDVNSINAFINQFVGKGCMNPVPLRLQEAIAIINERDPSFSLSHGVSEATMQAFNEFRQSYMTLRQQGRDMRALAPKYGKTFWYYMIR